MVIRSLVIATLLAGAASAHATPTSSTTVLGGWTLQSGSVSVVGALDAAVASGNWDAFSQAWNMHTSLTSKGDAASVGSALLFAPNATGVRAGGAGGGGDVGAVGGGGAFGGGGGDISGGIGGVGGGAEITTPAGGAGGGGGIELTAPGGGVGTEITTPAGGIGGGTEVTTAGGGIGGGTEGTTAGGGIVGGTENTTAGGGVVGGPGITTPSGGFDNDLPVGPVNSSVAIAAEVPEPGSIALLLAGLAGAGFVSRRRSK